MKTIKKTCHINNLVVDFKLNIRDENNYDVLTICGQIEDSGRINTPLVVKAHPTEEGKFVPLQGNRRTLGGQMAYAKPEASESLKAALSKVDIVVYSEMTASEELGIIIDQGSMKPINRSELVKTVWRMDRQFMSEQTIINQLFFNLANYTGKMKKLVEIPTEKSAREKFLKTWFHGTVGNYLLAGAKMGEYIRSQMLQTARAEDGTLVLEHKDENGIVVPAESVEMRCSRQRITELSAAKTADEKATGWNPDNGGETFNALIEKFKGEDSGVVEVEKKTRPTVKELTDKADVFKSPILRAALKTAAGDADAGKGLFEMDERIYRLGLVTNVLFEQLKNISNVEVYKLVEAIVGNGPAADVDAALKPFTSK